MSLVRLIARRMVRRPEPASRSSYHLLAAEAARVFTPAPPEAEVADPPEAPPPAEGWRGSCRAVSADTGRGCALPAGHAGPHRHGSTAFVRCAAPSQTRFAARELLDAHATARGAVPMEE